MDLAEKPDEVVSFLYQSVFPSLHEKIYHSVLIQTARRHPKLNNTNIYRPDLLCLKKDNSLFVYVAWNLLCKKDIWRAFLFCQNVSDETLGYVLVLYLVYLLVLYIDRFAL